MSENQSGSNRQVEEGFQTLLNNANAARVVSQTIEGTIGPKGLDIMMVDRFGDVVITNDGVTILKLMEVKHPAAQMIINTARAQQAEVGDGTTTATIIAGALVAEGAAQVLKGVPVTKVLEGIDAGLQAGLDLLAHQVRTIDSLDDDMFLEIAAIAGRGHRDLAELIVQAARSLGRNKLLEPGFKLADTIAARELAASKVEPGIMLNKMPLSREVAYKLEDVGILVIDDALEPEEVSADAIKTEAGFHYYLQCRNEFKDHMQKLSDIGVKLVVADRKIADLAEEILTDHGILALARVSSREIEVLCRHTGAKKIKRSGLSRSPEELKRYLGYAREVKVDEELETTFVYNGQGEPWVTVMIGAATEEVVDERERMAKDAASAVQAAIKGGVVPGGGAIEIWLASQLEDLARDQIGMASYGIMCVKEALLRPFICMASNSGFNPWEKMGDVIAVQRKQDNDAISFDADNGELIDMWQHNIVDPALVKTQAIKAAGEVATAILRINCLIKMKDEPKNSAMDINIDER